MLGPDPGDGRGIAEDISCALWPDLMRERTRSSSEPDTGCMLNLGGLYTSKLCYLCTMCLFLFTGVYGKQHHMTYYMIFLCSSHSGSGPINCCNDMGHL